VNILVVGLLSTSSWNISIFVLKQLFRQSNFTGLSQVAEPFDCRRVFHLQQLSSVSLLTDWLTYLLSQNNY
jgi:hypothetical protein